MIRTIRVTLAFVLVAFAAGMVAIAASQGKGKEPAGQERKEASKPARARVHKHVYGMDLLGDKLASNGDQKLLVQGKFAISVDIRSGKIAGLKVRHTDKGDVPVTKYVKKAERPGRSDARLASLSHASYAQLVPMWIGYGYTDDENEETVFWFPIDVILDGDGGAIEYDGAR